MKSLELTSTDLEVAVAQMLSRLGGETQLGPKDAHDAEIAFPNPFVRQVRGGYVARINSNKRIVVEVKSDLKGETKLSDLRQLHDWVLRESRRIVPVESQDYYMSALEEAKRNADFRLPRQGSLDKPDREDLAREAVEGLISAVDLAVMSLTFCVKGLLVINHTAALQEKRKGRYIGGNALQYAQANHLAVMTWQQLLTAAERVESGSLDMLDFWCLLFETDGAFELVEYDWKDRSIFMHSLFSPAELIVISESKFLRPEPEAVLVRPQNPSIERTGPAASRPARRSSQ